MKAWCDKCNGAGAVDQPYLSMTVMPDLLAQQTPQSVWDEYSANGYMIHQAVAEELSYDDSL